MPALVDVRVEHSVRVIVVLLLVLVHHQLRLMGRLGLLQLVETLVQLDVSELLLDPPVSVRARDVLIGLPRRATVCGGLADSTLAGTSPHAVEHGIVVATHRPVRVVRCPSASLPLGRLDLNALLLQVSLRRLVGQIGVVVRHMLWTDLHGELLLENPWVLEASCGVTGRVVSGSLGTGN